MRHRHRIMCAHILGAELTHRALISIITIIGLGIASGVVWWHYPPHAIALLQPEASKMTTSTMIATINSFVATQNQNRGQPVYGGGTVPLDYNALTGNVPSGGNAVTGISGIAAGSAAIALPSAQPGNTVIIDGGISTIASTSGAHSYSLFFNSDGTETVTDNNTGNSEAITGATYFVLNGGATTPTGAFQSAYLIETGVNAEIASMYNAAFKRVPDFAGLEFNAIPAINGALSLHQTAVDFLAAPEFSKLWPAFGAADNGGPNDQTFITDLYGQILHRTPTASEINFYVEDLQGKLPGQNTPDDRAQLLIYFSISPENQKDVSASSGGWLINPANGPVSLGAITPTQANTLIAGEAASGTINAADFSGMPNTASASAQISGGTVSITGDQYFGTPSNPAITINAAGITVNLNTQYYTASILQPKITINGVNSGGSVILIENQASYTSGIGNTVPPDAGSGTINLYGNGNWIQTSNPMSTSLPALVVPTIVNGWNSTDVLVGSHGSIPGPQQSAASLLAVNNGVVYQGASTPISGATLAAQASGTWFAGHVLAINVGALTDDSLSTIATAANKIYTVGDFGSAGSSNSEQAFFFGQETNGNTMVVYWHGDYTHAGTVLAADFGGSIELVGVQATSLTSINFHR